MGLDPMESGGREQRAREWIQALTELPERCAGTAAERAAAERVAGWMKALGIPDVSFEPVAARPRSGLTLALHAAVGALGCMWGGLPGTLVAAFAAWSFRTEFRRNGFVLSALIGRPESVNVIGRIGAVAPARRVVLSAHIDAAQAGWLFSPRLTDSFARRALGRRRAGQLPAGPLALPEGLLVAGAVLTLISWLGTGGFLVWLASTIVLVGLLVGCVLGAQWAWAPATPGANDNASAVAAMLDCAEQLKAELPPDVELWLVGTGAEEVGCVGMRTFVGARTAWPIEHTYFINFECLGGGALHYIRTEGVLTKGGYPPMLLELARRVVAGGTFDDVRPTDLLAGTDGHVPAEHGYPTLSLISLETNGVPRNYHRLEDTPEGIDAAMVVRGADFGAAVALAALRGAAGPIAA